jgi:glyoxylase-like metal-dependent hydrolase (beta-lactamase superfamily II)
MDKLPIPEYDEVPLEAIAPGLTGLRILFVNVFAITTPQGGWVLVDSGIPYSAGRIRKWTGSQFGHGATPLAIVQTHGHFDHAGSLEDLAKDWDVPIYAHRDEMPFLSGREKYPPPDTSAGGGVMTLMSPLFPRGPVDVTQWLRELEPDGQIPELPEWRWLHTPGHTAGHISLFRERDRALIVGDAFCTTKSESLFAAAKQKPELHGPPAYYTPDWDQARNSVRKLADLKPAILAPGHGMPMAGPEVESGLQTLAREFDRIARPSDETRPDTRPPQSPGSVEPIESGFPS